VLATVDRRGLWRAQTPQMFRVGELADAWLRPGEWREITDEASAMELRGTRCSWCEGSACNIKVTYPAIWPWPDSGWSRRALTRRRDAGE
jgi:2-C-methyl-D-erythritol 4-phosphate cytidylyltransferase